MAVCFDFGNGKVPRVEISPIGEGINFAKYVISWFPREYPFNTDFPL